MRYKFFFQSCFLASSFIASFGSAAPTEETVPPETIEPTSREQYELINKSAFWVRSRHEKAHNAVLPPLLSYVLPGFDQWIEGQFGYAGVYTGLGVGGLALSSSAKRQPTKFGDLTSRDPEIRKYLVGSSIYSLAGGMSAYQSFRTAVTTQSERYPWLDPKLAETPQDLALAPFQFSYLGRHTTYIPLGLMLALFGAGIHFDNEKKWYGPSWGDAEMAGLMSYGAGVNEEAAFRGFMMPWLRTGVPSNWGANLLTSTVFAAAHIASDHRIPWPQFIFGYYMGYLTQANNWTLGESIFIHTWWDVIAFLGEYATTQKGTFIFNPGQITF